MPAKAAFLLWLVFLTTWWLAAGWVAKGTVKAGRRERVAWFLGFGLGFGLLFSAPAGGIGHRVATIGLSWPRAYLPLWRAPAAVGFALLAGEVGAFAFGWWARLHLGRLWSGMMTLREGHRVVDTGPYRLVRHPIYTAFIAAAWMLALIEATPVTLAGAAVLTLVTGLKARAEEGFLRRELGAAGYDAYAARTPMLVPFLPRP